MFWLDFMEKSGWQDLAPSVSLRVGHPHLQTQLLLRLQKGAPFKSCHDEKGAAAFFAAVPISRRLIKIGVAGFGALRFTSGRPSAPANATFVAFTKRCSFQILP